MKTDKNGGKKKIKWSKLLNVLGAVAMIYGVGQLGFMGGVMWSSIATRGQIAIILAAGTPGMIWIPIILGLCGVIYFIGGKDYQ